MNMQEYLKVSAFTYREYCDYLQQKYGCGTADYMIREKGKSKWSKNRACTRTMDGLYAHHKMEDRANMLSVTTEAIKYPFAWQKAENIVYCDALEHLFLHILIKEYPAGKNIGSRGLHRFIIPSLNDVFSGYISNFAWERRCNDMVVNDKDVYIALMRRYLSFNPSNTKRKAVQASAHLQRGWALENNRALIEQFM